MLLGLFIGSFLFIALVFKKLECDEDDRPYCKDRTCHGSKLNATLIARVDLNVQSTPISFR